MILTKFECTVPINKPRAANGWMNRFEMGGDAYIDLCILPPWNRLTEQDLKEDPNKNSYYNRKKEVIERDHDLKTLRIYYEPNESFHDLKVRIARFLDRKEEASISIADLRMWRLENDDWQCKNQE